ncbi:MAG TPA: DEAD/DEAH box helicase, partial [Acidimicrobiales bacterium]|nr:DEAD/DEAH box helicase [Acidimicrobiales bacterium]
MASLERFSPVARAWFEAAFAGPTAAQEQGWDAISKGDHTLILAPTGSGKTLAAFLWTLDRLISAPQGLADDAGDSRPKADEAVEAGGSTGGGAPRVRVLYVSPLKALTYDVERNLRAPLAGMALEAERRGLPVPSVRVGTRTGDTSAADRRDIARHPPDILITTPESLYLLLTSQAREVLRTVEYVIVDEIHSVAGTKRGAHLALSLERLEHLVLAGGGPAPQRIGLSATQRPLEEIARFLAGTGRSATIVDAGRKKQLEIEVIVP